ncbi:hypothetical protein CGC21_22520 [Leishmania donovani]|uniref:Uncharacterized protein n=1 Tax=Leishmania donovani TaxID=5661 RepID=A0A504Y2K1_LEIDO|nr:hypothetical protein CGC21_22520 [Leishmania donovani]
MHSRIPLSIVFSAEGRRHVIPHRTFRVAAQAADGSADASTYTGAAEEGIAFFQYLDSNDTRMPPHPHLRAYAHPAEEYETYVGEEVWNATDEAPTSASGHPPVHDTGKARSGSASCCATSEDSAPVPSFRSVVEWVNSVFEEEWASDGVVLCGRYVVADDGAWVVPSRSPALYTTREVFLLMRNSSKFLHDVHAQVIDVRASARRGAHSGSLTFEFTLAKSLAGSGASEMRAILPYPLHFSPQKRAWAVDDTAASLSFTGIGQRVTDVCFPSLMAWTEAEHDDNFRFMQRRIEQAALLERTCVADPGFISRLVRAFDKRMHQESAADEVSGRQHSHPSLALLLALDLLFESPSLPIYVLSAKARVFEVAPRTSAPGICGLRYSPTRTPQAQKVLLMALPLLTRLAEATQSCAGAMGPDDSNKPSRGVQHYCVIASESADLVACADTRTKRGLPLELMHPELLEMNEEAAGFLKMLREGLLKRPGGDN